MKRSISIVFIILLDLQPVIYWGCSEPEEDKANACQETQTVPVDMCREEGVKEFIQRVSSNPFLSVQDKIAIPAYSFIEGSYQSGGDAKIASLQSSKNDCCNVLRLVDRFSTRPEFEWSSVSNKLIVAAIFESPVELFPNGLSIKNTESIVWTWDSGMGTGMQSSGVSYVRYSDGKRVIDSQVSDTELVPLQEGKMYVWCVWAWNDDGTKIEKASSAIPFVVENFSFEMNSINLIDGDWQVESAIRKADLKDVKDTFPFAELAIDVQCTEGTFTINNSKTGDILLRENRYIDFPDASAGISTLEIKWLCPNSVSAVTFANGSEVEVLLIR